MKIIARVPSILIAYLPAIFWATTIFILSGQKILPGFSVVPADFILKKGAHLAVYAVLYGLLFRASWLTRTGKNTTALWLVPLLLTILYAVSDELHQSFVPGRFGTIRDIGIDALGASIAFLRIYKYI